MELGRGLSSDMCISEWNWEGDCQVMCISAWNWRASIWNSLCAWNWELSHDNGIRERDDSTGMELGAVM